VRRFSISEEVMRWPGPQPGRLIQLPVAVREGLYQQALTIRNYVVHDPTWYCDRCGALFGAVRPPEQGPGWTV
jgi:hypothetical protein